MKCGHREPGLFRFRCSKSAGHEKLKGPLGYHKYDDPIEPEANQATAEEVWPNWSCQELEVEEERQERYYQNRTWWGE